ncbi:MAG: hypothetical protein M4579_002194 [Chaenotheca gracillima]|nr:MAG: hypothetical protein M4579_002194 [Chaenotheca gracillima]
MSSSYLALLPLLLSSLSVPSLAAEVPPALSNILSNTHQSPLYTYPTDLTRNIPPVKIHSHNDYWRDLPFYSALSVGAISIEADVWLYNDTLYVGHEQSALTKERTLKSLYIDPILDTLRRENPESPFVDGPTKNGVFDTAGTQTLYLWIDIKTDGETAFPYVVKALEPLRSAGYLTTVNDTSSTTSTPFTGPVTVIGTGNTPLSAVRDLSPRDVFYDAPLPALAASAPASMSENITSSSPITLIASVDFAAVFGNVVNVTLNDTQMDTMRDQISGAHDKGIGVRYWDTPAWPVSTRNAIWRLLVNEGVDLVNVDDLVAGAGLGERAEYW